MTKTYCDKCGKETGEYVGLRYYAPYDWQDRYLKTSETIKLCKNCYKKNSGFSEKVEESGQV